MHSPFQKIRIPKGWEIEWYAFDDLNPADMSEDDPRWSDLTNNLLFVKYPMGNGYVAIDIGWYPEGQRDGHYRLNFIINKYEAEETILLDNNQKVILYHLEQLMFFITNFSGDIHTLFSDVVSKKYLEYDFKEANLEPVMLWGGIIQENQFYKANSLEHTLLRELVPLNNSILIFSLIARGNSSPKEFEISLNNENGNFYYELIRRDKNQKILSADKLKTTEEVSIKLTSRFYSGNKSGF